MRIALIEDDTVVSDQVSRMVAEDGHSVVAFPTGGSILNALKSETFDLLLLDLGLPDINGENVLEWAKSNIDPPPPVLIVTARDKDADIVEFLNRGADDYVTKPIAGPLLKARVEALLRRRAGGGRSGQEVYRAHVFDLRNRSITIDGAAVRVTDKQFALALMLFRNLGRSLSRSELLASIWRYEPGLHSRTLDIHVGQVRKRLGLNSANGLRLTAVYNFGYRLEYTDADDRQGGGRGVHLR